MFHGPRNARGSARHPAVRPLVLPAVHDPALFPAGDEIENNFLAAIQPGSAVPLGGREDQPMPLYDFICAGFAQHLVAAVRFQDQRRRLTRDKLPGDFNRRTPVGPGKITLGANREGGEK
jgi:hypothetical protein